MSQYRELAWGVPEVIETPGHTKDHIVLLERKKGWCFTGDLFISERQRLIRAEDDAAALIRSMESVAALETAAGNLILFTSVGRIVEDGRAALRAAAHHLTDLARKAQALEKKGLSISAIRDELIGEESTLAQLTDGAFSGEHLIRAVLKVEID